MSDKRCSGKGVESDAGKGYIEGLKPEVVIADRMYEFDRSLFGVDEMPPEQLLSHARTVARKIADSL